MAEFDDKLNSILSNPDAMAQILQLAQSLGGDPAPAPAAPAQAPPPPPPYYGASAEPAPSIGWGVLGFFFPIVGLILFLVWHDDYPKRAKMCGKGALISVIVWVAFFVLWIIIAVIIVAVAGASSAFAALLLI